MQIVRVAGFDTPDWEPYEAGPVAGFDERDDRPITSGGLPPWLQMAPPLLFVGGVMNIVWIAGLTIFVLLEKVVPLGHVVSRIAGAGLLAWGGWLLFAALQQ